QPTLLNLNAVVAKSGELLHRVIGEDVALITVLDPALGCVQADPSQIEQTVVNLVVNARDAMPEGGRITLETANVELDQAYARRHVEVRPGPHVMLAVSDTGVGMDPDTRARIFEPFFTTKGPGQGTGLGLATVYGIITQSGGHIAVDTKVGQGTSFNVYLPWVGGCLSSDKSSAAARIAPHGKETTMLAA